MRASFGAPTASLRGLPARVRGFAASVRGLRFSFGGVRAGVHALRCKALPVAHAAPAPARACEVAALVHMSKGRSCHDFHGRLGDFHRHFDSDNEQGGTVSDIDRETEGAVRRFLSLIADRYDIAGAIIYGSRARGTHRPESDADVAFDVLLETGILVSPLSVWLDEWEHPEDYPNPALLQRIGREGVRL